MHLRSLSLFLCLCLPTVSFTACGSRSSKRWVSKTSGTSFELPNDPSWKQIPAPYPEGKLVLTRTNQSAAIIFVEYTQPIDPFKEVDEVYARSWERGYFRKTGGQKLSGELFTFHGQKAYKLSEQLERNGRTARVTTILWAHRHKLFSISATGFEGDPLADPVIKAFVDSAQL